MHLTDDEITVLRYVELQDRGRFVEEADYVAIAEVELLTKGLIEGDDISCTLSLTDAGRRALEEVK